MTDEGGNILYQSMEADLVYEWIQEDDSRAETAEDWISDSMTAEIAGETITIEAVGSVYYSSFLENFYLIFWLIIPCYLLLAALGSYFLAKRAMQPIRRITDTVRSINGKAWSGRTHDIQSRDEVGELAETFNEMMDELEISYERERQFTSDASHELRTPITVIRACAEEALETEDAEVSRENLLAIQNETEKMTRMITQLLFLSRGYEGRLHFDPEEISLYDMAASVSEELATEAKKKAITIHNRVPEETVLTADQSLFTNLLVNLIGNAVKYGKEGGNVWIDAKTEGDDLFLTVADDGIGISEEDLPHIFDRFYRADAARDRSGSGLGLSICKWIVQMHGGTIRAVSKAGEGSSFFVQMPVCPGSRKG